MASAKVPVTFTPVDARKVEAALARIQSQAKGVNFGRGAESINKLSRPLGKITGQATEFQKSLEASNARVLAFGASVAVINKLSEAFGALVSNTIKVEATFAKINTILGGTRKEIQQFGDGIFKVAQQTGTSFDEVAEGALELARQGLSVEQTLSRVETSLKLVRVAGIDSQQAVAGLTAAIKGFEGAGLTVAQIADKLAEVDTKFAVSTEDLINGLERASASARVAGVSFDELLAVVTTVQERTQRGGAVIGNAFKTIFARLSRTDTLQALNQLGIEVLDAQGNVRGAIPLFQELAVELDKLGLQSVRAGDIIQKVAGVRQRDILISLVEDLNSGQSQFAKALGVSATAAGALDAKNAKLNDTLEALINNLTVGGQKLASVLGEIGFTDAAKDILKTLSSVVSGITDILQGESAGAKFAQGLLKGVGSVLTGPGLALISAIFVKLFIDLAKFGKDSLKQILGINKAAQQQAALQQSVLQTLLQNENIQREILALEGNKVAQEQLLLKIYNQQAAALARVQKAAATVTPGLFGAGLRGGERGVVPKGNASGGYIAAEARDVSRGVGGAPASSKVVSIPNFAFGGGKRGTMVANTSEYIVPNFAGGGDAIFNRDMVRSMGLPTGARKINAAGGYVPNFASAAKMSAAFNRMSGPEFVSRFGQAEFNLRQRAATTGMAASQRKKEADAIRKRRTSGLTAGAITKNKSQARSLELIANGMIGVASLFPESLATSVTTTRLSRDDLAALKRKGYSNVKSVTLKGIQNRSLRDYQRNKAGAEANLRKRLVGIFTEPLIQFGNSIISKDFQNDEAISIKKELLNKKRDPNLFSTAVQGGLLESAIRLVVQGAAGIQDFKNNKGDGAAFDFEEMGEASGNFKKAFGFDSDLIKADAKRTASSEAIRTLIGKTLRDESAFRFVKKIGRAANGYIPNFAGGALEQAVAREQSAGLPINQIRINQSGKLRNAQNPQGLAVTNTRDEPTGAIPNFALTVGSTASRIDTRKQISGAALNSFAKNLDQTGKKISESGKNLSVGLDNSITKIFALQLATSGLTSAFTEQDTLMSRFGEAASSAINTLLVMSTIGVSPLGAFGKGGGGLKGIGALLKGAKNAAGALNLLKGLAGPVALGLTALDVILKTFTGKGAFGYLGDAMKALGLNVKSASKEIETFSANLQEMTAAQIESKISEIDAMISERRASVSQERGSDREKFESRVLRAEQKFIEKFGQREEFEGMTPQQILSSENIQNIAQRSTFLGLGMGDDAMKIIAAQNNLQNFQNQEAFALSKQNKQNLQEINELEEEREKFSQRLADLKSEEAENAKTLLQNLQKAGAAATQVSLAFSRRQNQLEIQSVKRAGARAEMERRPMGSVERARFSIQAERDAAAEKTQMARLDIRKKLVEQVKLENSVKGIQKEQLDNILRQAHEYGSIEKLQEAISSIQGISLDNLDEQVRQAKLQNAQLDETVEKDRTILNLRQQQAVAAAKANIGLAKYSSETQKKLIDQAEDLPNVLAQNIEQSMANTFDKLATGAYDSIGDAFLNIALDFGRELQRQIMQRTAANITSSLFGQGTAGGGFLNTISGAITRRNTGGLITGGSGVRDDVPAVLTGGEYVVRKSAVQKYGLNFLEDLNSGSIQGMQGGGFFVPGTRGQGAITGKANLLAFATQEGTSGATDQMRGFAGGAGINLEQQSSRLTAFGRFRDSPARRALKEAQQQAFGLYVSRIEEEKRIEEEVRAAKRARRQQLQASIIGSFANAAMAGAGTYFQGLGTTTSGLEMGATDLVPSSAGGYTPGGQFNSNFSNPLEAANGGQMSGRTNALLMGGEYVISASAASRIGRENLDSINAMRFQNGGPVGNVASSSGGSMSGKGADVGEVNITINMAKGDASVTADSNGNTDPTKTKEFARKVKEVVVNVIAEEKRVSGSLFTRAK